VRGWKVEKDRWGNWKKNVRVVYQPKQVREARSDGCGDGSMVCVEGIIAEPICYCCCGRNNDWDDGYR